MIKGTIDSYELWQSRPENLNENMEDPIKSAENRGWNQCNRSWIKTIEEQPRVGEWIPCSERLPEAEGEYLCSLYYAIPPYNLFHPENDIYIHTISIQKFDGTSFKSSVIAWMPLPEPYKENEE